jgi:hypothetical protein
MSDDDEGHGFSAGIELLGGLKLAIGDLSGELRAGREHSERLRHAQIEAQPRTVKGARDFTTGIGATTACWSIGSPERGYIWLLRRLWIGGSTITATPTGTATLFVRPTNPSNDLSPADVEGFTSGAFPQIAYWSNEQVAITERERLWIYITTAAASTQYVAAWRVLQYTIDHYKEAFQI